MLDEPEDDDDDPDEEFEPAAAEVVAAPTPVAAQEVNRLGSVPDLIDDDDSLIELPPITPSGSVVAHPQSHYSPVLAETLYIPPPQARVTTTVAAMVADEKPRHHKAPRRKPKRRPVADVHDAGRAVRTPGRRRLRCKEVLAQGTEVDRGAEAARRRGLRRPAICRSSSRSR